MVFSFSVLWGEKTSRQLHLAKSWILKKKATGLHSMTLSCLSSKNLLQNLRSLLHETRNIITNEVSPIVFFLNTQDPHDLDDWEPTWLFPSYNVHTVQLYTPQWFMVDFSVKLNLFNNAPTSKVPHVTVNSDTSKRLKGEKV